MQQHRAGLLSRASLIAALLAGSLLAGTLGLGCAPDRAPPPPLPSAAPPPPRVPVLEQRGVGCVPYAAAAVAQLHGHDVDPLELLRAVPVSARGVAYEDVAAELRRRGVDAEVIHPSVAELRASLARGEPLVIGQSRSARGDHALVLERYEDGRYLVMDPANPGRRSMDASDVEQAYEATGRQAIRVPAR